MVIQLWVLVFTAAAALPGVCGAWYDGLPSVKVFFPAQREALQQEAADLHGRCGARVAQFAPQRNVLLLTPGDYGDTVIKVGYYTQVAGVGPTPNHVRLKAVACSNDAKGMALVNFWRAAEGLTLAAPSVTWAVSQASPLRRLVVEGNLHLSDGHGWSSGGFLADVEVRGVLDMGVQQQWFARNTDLGKGVICRAGWNYVFMGMAGLSNEAAWHCRGGTPGKVSTVARTPRVAEKPYVVLDDDGVWKIFVPAYHSCTLGMVAKHQEVARKLVLEEEVFVAAPGMSAEEINAGIASKGGVLFTPGIYELEEPVLVQESGFVVLGLGFATLVSDQGLSAIEVADGLQDVRIAGVLLEAGNTDLRAATQPLLKWGSAGLANPPLVDGHKAVPGGVLSDLFARVGAFRYRGCAPVRADVMVEINANDVVLDNLWLWHADHDDCKLAENKYGSSKHHAGQFLDSFASNNCYSRNGLRVTGSYVTAYGLAVEHVVDGDNVWWEGEHGQTFFYQAELPYHWPSFGDRGYSGYSVAPSTSSHQATGLSIYLIGRWLHARAAVMAPPTASITQVVSVVIHGSREQFAHTACWHEGSQTHCYAPQSCSSGGGITRCFLAAIPRKAKTPAEILT